MTPSRIALILITLGFDSSVYAQFSPFGFPPGVGVLRIRDENSNLTVRPFLNFTGGGVSCADNTAGRTDCTIAAGAAGTLQTAYNNTAGTVPSILLTSRTMK